MFSAIFPPDTLAGWFFHSPIAMAVFLFFATWITAAYQLFYGRKIYRQGDWFQTLSVLAGLLLSLIIFFRFAMNQSSTMVFHQQWTWFSVGGYPIKIGIYIDQLTSVMLVVVTLVSTLVHLFSTAYMTDDPRYSRFFAYLGIFTGSMLGLILSDNLLVLFCFWELVGLSSYLLIGFFFEKSSAASAATKAFLTNRIGDIGMILGIILFFTATGTFTFTELFQKVGNSPLVTGHLFGISLLTIAGVLLFMGSVGKSAQFPLHVWLPDAMEGPTPVSALIHSATMVAAGVYLVGRAYPLFTPAALAVIALVGGFTALFAATIAMVQYDIKRVLAYSTISQLGYMILALGVGAYTAGLFHLMTHAFFKSLLFLGSGAIIHALHHEQDMRNMGGLWKKLPITFVCFLTATLAITGIPFFSGSLSKDAILAGTLSFLMKGGSSFLSGPFAMLPALFGFLAAVMTAFYMFRLIFLTFMGKPRVQESYDHAAEVPWSRGIALFFVAIFAVLTRNIPLIGFASVLAALFYAALLLMETFSSSPSPDQWIHGEKEERHGGKRLVDWRMTIPLMVLAALSLSCFYQSGWFKEKVIQPPPLVSISHEQNSIREEARLVEEEHIEHKAHQYTEFLALLCGLIGIAIAAPFFWPWFKKRFSWASTCDPEIVKKRWLGLNTLLFNKYFLDEIYFVFITLVTNALCPLMAWFDRVFIDALVNQAAESTWDASNLHRKIDLEVVDGLVNGTGEATQNFGKELQKTQTGRIQDYLLAGFALTALLIAVKVLW